MSSEIAIPTTASAQRPPAPGPGSGCAFAFGGGAHELDRALAVGASPQTARSFRSAPDQLSRPEVRKRLAGTYTRLTDEREGQIGLLPFHYDRVRVNRGPLGEIGDLLGGKGPLPLRGVALASALLDDRMGPLYANDVPADLAGSLKRILAALGR